MDVTDYKQLYHHWRKRAETWLRMYETACAHEVISLAQKRKAERWLMVWLVAAVAEFVGLVLFGIYVWGLQG